MKFSVDQSSEGKCSDAIESESKKEEDKKKEKYENITDFELAISKKQRKNKSPKEERKLSKETTRGD